MASARLGHRGNTGGGQPPPPMVIPVWHAGAMAVLKWINQDHSAVQEGGGAETTVFGGGRGKGSNLKGVQTLPTHPQDRLVLQIPGNSTIGSG